MNGPAATPVRFADLPVADAGHLRRRLRPRPTRRTFLGSVLGAGTAVGLGSLFLLNRAAETARAAYWLDWTSTTTGPCASYARDHTENGIQCGVSQMCLTLSCCWKYRNGAGNVVGWHKNAPGSAGYYVHRPDECWNGTYDSWHWRFSDGRTYRCSDGWTCSPSGSCFKSICPWVV
ncbi:hypothetical protein [Ornithinimicrobium pekingense]|uniref:Twin-arginine translocation signal domain-containing protein n=1 Tax=Ornithinimicrobium pekingense TaxID=384677 RepID=A0ABQ2F407_9MICO|nr:hypothetical protein [Ornithinimicrobium pekingense]GGK58119.1 hypothetical protein GCM10011509_03170 [Ornithinimicrobium pekingense]